MRQYSTKTTDQKGGIEDRIGMAKDVEEASDRDKDECRKPGTLSMERRNFRTTGHHVVRDGSTYLTTNDIKAGY